MKTQEQEDQEEQELPQTNEEETPENPELCLYVVTQDRVFLLNRMLASIITSSRKPERVIIISPDKYLYDSFYTALLRKLLSYSGVSIDSVNCKKTAGLSERKNIALHLMQKGGYKYGFSIDDDMVLDPHCIERLMEQIEDRPDIFAVGPTVQQPSATGLSNTKELAVPEMVEVVRGEWRWKGFIQGITEPMHEIVYAVDHLAGCYLHRVEQGDSYDEEYDRPGNFLHESDFLFKRGLLAVKDAIVHHWPPVAVNLWDSKEEHKEDILINAQYFAKKHCLGNVKKIQWEGFEEVEHNDLGSGSKQRRKTRVEAGNN